jgi:hypothetical protein
VVIHEFPDHDTGSRRSGRAAMSFTPSASSAWSACPRSETNWGWRYRREDRGRAPIFRSSPATRLFRRASSTSRLNHAGGHGSRMKLSRRD